jgi:hypothetical protein
MTAENNKTPWLCHICDYSSNIGEGQACCECYKIACHEHMTVATVLNSGSGLYELKQVCVECQLRKEL